MEAEAEAEAFEPTEAPAPAPAGELHSREWPLAPILSRRPPLAPGATNSASEEEAAAEEAARAADAADKEWVREELSDAQLEARAAAVGRRYEGKLLPAAGEELVTSMAQCWLVSVLPVPPLLAPPCAPAALAPAIDAAGAPSFCAHHAHAVCLLLMPRHHVLGVGEPRRYTLLR